MKRFWQTVSIERGEVMLDGRPVRTPGRVPLAVPYPSLAGAIADEWRAVSGEIDPRAMPLTGLANAAIDRIAPDPGAFAEGLARYGESDLLCYRADGPAALVDRQHAAWDPLLDWARQHAKAPLLKSLTELRIARVQLGQGNAAQALTTLDQIPAGDYQGLAQELRGDVLVKLKRPDDARKAYEAAKAALGKSELQGGDLQMKIDDLAVAGKQGA